MAVTTGVNQADTAAADAAILAALPHASSKLLARLRAHLIHREQLRRLGVVPVGKPGSAVATKGG